MLAKRIIPCLDVRNGRVVKGVQFKDHKDLGSVDHFLENYQDADELVFYEISASSKGEDFDWSWIDKIASHLSIPFCVAGGINTLDKAKEIINRGADKVSINTPALQNPSLIEEFAKEFGSQSVVVGIDSKQIENEYYVHSHTGSTTTIRNTLLKTKEWIKEAESRGAGEIVLNCMNQDGMRKGYDLAQLNIMLHNLSIPLVASGGAGALDDFVNVFKQTNSSAALAASVFHTKQLTVSQVRSYLKQHNIPTRSL